MGSSLLDIRKKPAVISGDLDIVSFIPSQYGTIRKVTNGKWQNSKSKTIIHIQDIHQNLEAQTNIAKTIQELINQGHVDLVALEGDFKPIDLTLYRDYPEKKSHKKLRTTFCGKT